MAVATSFQQLFYVRYFQMIRPINVLTLTHAHTHTHTLRVGFVEKSESGFAKIRKMKKNNADEYIQKNEININKLMRPNGGRFVVYSYNLVKWALFSSSLPLHSLS